VHTGGHLGAAPSSAVRSASRRRSRWRRVTLTGGGAEGNEQLTAIVGVLLIVLLAVIGVTILRIRQLISIHLFVGLLLIGPVVLKMASTGYRFMRYYTHNRVYREKGPPQPLLRLIAPVVVLSTVIVFISGIVLMFEGPRHRDPYLLIHKASFFVWVAFTGLHVLGHIPGLGRALRPTQVSERNAGISPGAGAAGRWIALSGALVAGVVLAIVLIPHFGPWTAAGALEHHHGG
jgi:hypothetical protein